MIDTHSITFQTLSDLPLPTHLARNIMSCLIYAQAIGKVLVSGENDPERKEFKIKCSGSSLEINDLETKLRNTLKGTDSKWGITYTEDTMKPKDPNQKPHDWENSQTFELTIYIP